MSLFFIRNKKKQLPRGLSRIEVVVVLLVALFFAFLIKMRFSYYQAKAIDSARAYNLNIITQALEFYHQEKGYYPPYILNYPTISFGHIINGTNDILTKELAPNYLDKLDPSLYNSQSFVYGAKRENITFTLNCQEGSFSYTVPTNFSYCGYNLAKCFDDQDYYIVYCLQRLPVKDNAHLIEKHTGNWVVSEEVQI